MLRTSLKWGIVTPQPWGVRITLFKDILLILQSKYYCFNKMLHVHLLEGQLNFFILSFWKLFLTRGIRGECGLRSSRGFWRHSSVLAQFVLKARQGVLCPAAGYPTGNKQRAPLGCTSTVQPMFSRPACVRQMALTKTTIVCKTQARFANGCCFRQHHLPHTSRSRKHWVQPSASL